MWYWLIALGHERPGRGIGNAALGTADGFIAAAVWRGAIVAVSRDFGHRDRLGPLLFERRNLFAKNFLARRLFGRHVLVDRERIEEEGVGDLSHQQPLAFRPVLLGLLEGLTNIGRELCLDGFGHQALEDGRFDGFDLGLHRSFRGVDLGHLLLVGFRLGSRHQRISGLDVAEQGSFHGVVVALQDGIELVIVTARALHRQSQNTSSNGRDQIVQIVVAALGVVFFAEGHARAGAQEAGGDQAVFSLPIQFVAGDLFLDKYVVRLVLIVGAHHIIAVTPGFRTVVIVLEAARIGVTRDVQPVPAPALAVAAANPAVYRSADSRRPEPCRSQIR